MHEHDKPRTWIPDQQHLEQIHASLWWRWVGKWRAFKRNAREWWLDFWYQEELPKGDY